MKTQVKTRDMWSNEDIEAQDSPDSDGVPVEVEEDTSEQHRHRLESAERRAKFWTDVIAAYRGGAL